MSDKFTSMKALLDAVPETGNYTFDIYDKYASTIKLFAPHGGCIEPGTRQIVKSLAHRKWDHFIFIGQGVNCKDSLHVTSKNYDEERCVKMAKEALLALAIHGCTGAGSRIEVGGGSSFAPSLLGHLKNLEYPAVIAQNHIDGKSPNNFVNFARKGGIQLELSPEFREYLYFDYPRNPKPRSDTFDKFIVDLRRWLLEVELLLGSKLEAT